MRWRPCWARTWPRRSLSAPQVRESEIRVQRERIAELHAAVAQTQAIRARRNFCPSSSIWFGAVSGSSVATAGRMTSAMAAWTTCWRVRAT